MNLPPLEVLFWGEHACFTRPEMKVERVSYPVPTPSAARGMLEAIFWKPEIEWRVREIHVLEPIRWASIRRNEVSKRASGGVQARYVEDDRVQRSTLALRDVRYLVRADIVLKPDSDKDIAAYRDQFRRRVKRGSCFHRPYLGAREFAANFDEPTGSEQAREDVHGDVGRMLFDLAFRADGTGEPIFFDAQFENGVLRVPDELYEQRAILLNGGLKS